MRIALFINGVFEETLAEIATTQHANPGKVCYLQPYAGRRITLLAESDATTEAPITLYISVTGSLSQASYQAKIVGWQDKRELANNEQALAELNQHIKIFQPSEQNIYLQTRDGKRCANLISVADVTRLKTPFPVSCLIKVADGQPLKPRPRAGGWCRVREQVAWLGKLSQVLKADVETSLESGVVKSLADDETSRNERLATAPKIPESIQVVSRAFRRNPDVIAAVIIRANGVCEECHSPAPFRRASNDTPYLEVHHRKMLSAGGEDTVANAVAVCPACHRRLHFGYPDARSDSPVFVTVE